MVAMANITEHIFTFFKTKISASYELSDLMTKRYFYCHFQIRERPTDFPKVTEEVVYNIDHCDGVSRS